jgi:hypothetical protein
MLWTKQEEFPLKGRKKKKQKGRMKRINKGH